MRINNDRLILIALAFILAGNILGYFFKIFLFLILIGVIIFVIQMYSRYKKE